MFGLPAFTAFVMVAIPSFWVIYTLIFLWLSRNWSREDIEEQPVPDEPGARPTSRHRENEG